MVEEAGFRVVGAGAFIGEHCFSNEDVHVGTGRPDEEDLRKAEQLGRSVKEKLRETNALEKAPLNIPRNVLLTLCAKLVPGKMNIRFARKPVLDRNLCNNCGLCANTCPSAAIEAGTYETLSGSLGTYPDAAEATKVRSVHAACNRG